MLFNELIAKVKDITDKINAADRKPLNVQVNIKGDNGGVFNVQVKDGKISVDPQENADSSCTVTMDMEHFNKLLDGELDPVKAYMFRQLKVDGDMSKALEFSNLLK